MVDDNLIPAIGSERSLYSRSDSLAGIYVPDNRSVLARVPVPQMNAVSNSLGKKKRLRIGEKQTIDSLV